ncbi:hypothetical protein MSG28_014873 [Choristoneura fumiferana]|uniref:Uncharacterized protein n=1 Tax=Choristoneura fumiferana TaxID=7141 RepID=A0ACC0KXN6_CHOFU|nr:hypothetical protein MSG28_014873 [Choristoneura fumiferana]
MSIAKILALDKLTNFFNILRQNGGIRGSLWKLYRQDDLKDGTLVGEDKFGNKYYENPRFFYSRNRWVEYSDNFHMNYDGSQNLCLQPTAHNIRIEVRIQLGAFKLKRAKSNRVLQAEDIISFTERVNYGHANNYARLSTVRVDVKQANLQKSTASTQIRSGEEISSILSSSHLQQHLQMSAMSLPDVTSARSSPAPDACPECDTSASVTSDLHKYQVACTCKPSSAAYARAEEPGPPAPAKPDTPPALPPRPPANLLTNRRTNAQHILLRAYTASPHHLETVPAAVPAAMIKVVGACCLVCALTCVLCDVVHGALYWCLRGVFALSVCAVLVCIFSCMLAYQLLSQYFDLVFHFINYSDQFSVSDLV